VKARIATEWLSGCSGCHVAVVDLHEKLLNVVEDVEFVRAPVLMDEKGYPEADIGLVEGAVRSEHDRKALQKMRASVKTLVAFGSCAVFSGPSGIGWLYSREEILATVYNSGPTNAGQERPGPDVPTLEASVVPIDEVVPVDFYLPGCPPSPYFIAAALKRLLSSDSPVLTGQSVCAGCNRKMTKNPGAALRKGAVTAEDDKTCFLSQGVICLGSVTLNRCLSPCPKTGVVCTGCNGPRPDVITEARLDIRHSIAQYMATLCGIDPNEVRSYMERDAKTYYSYAMASPVMYKKPTVELREWASLAKPVA
jgi:F420-non-reducing hydrogenase small subunit